MPLLDILAALVTPHFASLLTHYRHCSVGCSHTPIWNLRRPSILIVFENRPTGGAQRFRRCLALHGAWRAIIHLKDIVCLLDGRICGGLPENLLIWLEGTLLECDVQGDWLAFIKIVAQNRYLIAVGSLCLSEPFGGRHARLLLRSTFQFATEAALVRCGNALGVMFRAGNLVYWSDRRCLIFAHLNKLVLLFQERLQTSSGSRANNESGMVWTALVKSFLKRLH